MQGKIERIHQRVVHGWLMDEQCPDVPVTFHMFLNGQSLGVGRADIARADLIRKSVGTGEHGFRFALPKDAVLQEGDILSAVSSLDGAPLVPVYHVPPFSAPQQQDTFNLAIGPQVDFVPALQLRSSALSKRDLYDTTVPTVISSLVKIAQLPTSDAEKIIEKTFKEKDWQTSVVLCEAMQQVSEPSARLLGLHGRALIYLGRYEDAIGFLVRSRVMEPDNHVMFFYLGIAYNRLSRWYDAVEVFESCVALEPQKEAKYYLELGRALQRIGFGSYGVLKEDRSVLPRAGMMFERAIQLNDQDVEACRELAMLYLHLQRHPEALDAIELGLQRNAQHINAWLDYTRILVRLNRMDDAYAACVKALELAPHNDTCKFNHRLVSRLMEMTQPSAPVSVSLLITADTSAQYPQQAGISYITCPQGDGWREAIVSSADVWIGFVAERPFEPDAALTLLQVAGFEWAARVTDQQQPHMEFWRRDFLLSLLQAGTLALHAPLTQFLQLARIHARHSINNDRSALELGPTQAQGRKVLLFSQYGIHKFGGGEHFLQQMAHLYKAMGWDVLIVGTLAEYVGDEGEADGLRYRFIDRSPDEFIRLAIEEQAVLCHMISGLAFEVTHALRHYNITIIHGVHFWRDMMVAPTPSRSYYPLGDGEKFAARKEFNGVIRDSQIVYANSRYTRQELERLYGVCAPVIYSLPDALGYAEPQPEATATRDYVLLANCRVDKGFDLLVDVAKQLPHISFRAIASQSSRALAQSMIAEAGINNIVLLEHVSDMSSLYQHARVVVVPSYQFIETFSRVVIEAQRYGVPVVGSDKGNVPYLLIESGVSLPQEVPLWAQEIARLFEDEPYWRERSRLALENSQRYSFDMQTKRLSHVVSAAQTPVLIGVGSGLGNIIHTAPMIRNIALRTGRPVDVVMAGDHKDMLFVLANRDYVNHVFVLNDDVIHRRYDTVFLTHSFGTAIPAFSTNRLKMSRMWREFNPGHAVHEAEFNLLAAKKLLKVDYTPEDVSQYFLGDYSYTPPQELFVGFHAGCKGGVWGTKRWPHYATLAKRLKARGIRVASFGTADEYVAGTTNYTGGSIEEMTRNMLSCSHFVSNDSGVMNIANALGIPLVGLFAPTNVHTRGPLAKTSRSVAIDKDCSPCELDRNPQSRFNTATCDCIKEITVNAVIEALGI
jgi:glycosyltransferase involved in cell wall biosynthesis/ADP-heptose:LPS heptosyltransferase/Flp pilus assembly protein TadD